MNFSTELSKHAGPMTDALGTIISGLYSGTKSGLQFIGRHPKVTIGVIGGGALGIIGANKLLDLSDRVHDAYDIVENERKRHIMDKQVELLNGILAEQKKLNPVPAPTIPQRFIPVKPALL